MCRVCESNRGDIVVMDVIWRRYCVSMIICSKLAKKKNEHLTAHQRIF